MASRTYYASQAVGLYPKGFLGISQDWSDFGAYSAGYGSANMETLSGVQSVGFSSSVEFEQVFELGHLQIFENIEGSPTCEMTIERILGLGVTSLFQKFIGSTETSPTTAETRNYGVNMSNFASDRGCSARLSVHGDGNVMTSTSTLGGNMIYGFQIDGFTSNYSISAQTDGAVTESLGIAGVNLTHIPSGAANFDKQVTLTTSSPKGTFRRQDCSFSFQELKNGALNVDAGKGVKYYNRVQSASINIDVGREDLLEMGRKGPYIRYASFPVEVTCDVEYNVDRGVNTDPAVGGRFQDGVSNAKQQMTTIDSDSNCQLNPTEGYVVSVYGNRRHAPTGCDDVNDVTPGDGKPNEYGGTMYYFMAAISGAKLQSQSWSGGDTGGGVVTISESYTAFNAARIVAGHKNNMGTNGLPTY